MSENIQETVRKPDGSVARMTVLVALQIVGLINQASLYGRDSVRVQHLRHVQELILRKDPSLLDNFLEVCGRLGVLLFACARCLQEVLGFQTDKSPEVRKTIISFIEEAW